MTTTATRSNATGAPGYSETLPCEAASARRARSLVRDALTAWGLGCLVDSATLTVSELVANSTQHSGSRLIRVGIHLPMPDRVRIAVSDKSRAVPAVREAQNDEENGRGLWIVEEIAHQWGIDRRRWGKVVWAVLLVPGGARNGPGPDLG
ncbi:ATP-binding protein [Streptomyces sp. NPDC088725]|uniref:ATP-binding protein n=1 Tax=Streptomyces sp. NPDC088725 TaxID=3365873 RepID=UPI0038024E07